MELYNKAIVICDGKVKVADLPQHGETRIVTHQVKVKRSSGMGEKALSEKQWYKKKENWWIAIGGLIAVIALSIPFIIMKVSNSKFALKEFQNLGTVGDFFGGTTVGLLSLASITLVTAAIIMQKEELRLQRRELKLTRNEFETGNNTAKVQQIDNAFFNMLSLHHQIVNNIKLAEGGDPLTGREAITELKKIYENKFAFRQFKLEYPEEGFRSYAHSSILKGFTEKIFKNANTITQESLDEVYGDFHAAYGNNIGHYMRNNYRIVKFIVNNVANDEEEQKKIEEETGRKPIIGDKKYYFGMLRAQWSNAEFELILINSLYSENHKFKNLIIKHDVLDIEETQKKDMSQEVFILKESMDKFKAYKKLIEINK
ncbi:uncharacterized protein YdcH (DUF465 family) [Bacillus ectoiniformans]|nr:uncharacterized protein YdcH (DUF465 family) [Bacillus ectoiniformans]